MYKCLVSISLETVSLLSIWPANLFPTKNKVYILYSYENKNFMSFQPIKESYNFGT